MRFKGEMKNIFPITNISQRVYGIHFDPLNNFLPPLMTNTSWDLCWLFPKVSIQSNNRQGGDQGMGGD